MVRTKKFSEAVSAARCAKWWTQVECARRCRVSSRLISGIERGEVESVTRLTASKLERALGVDLSSYIKKSA